MSFLGSQIISQDIRDINEFYSVKVVAPSERNARLANQGGNRNTSSPGNRAAVKTPDSVELIDSVNTLVGEYGLFSSDAGNFSADDGNTRKTKSRGNRSGNAERGYPSFEKLTQSVTSTQYASTDGDVARHDDATTIRVESNRKEPIFDGCTNDLERKIKRGGKYREGKRTENAEHLIVTDNTQSKIPKVARVCSESMSECEHGNREIKIKRKKKRRFREKVQGFPSEMCDSVASSDSDLGSVKAKRNKKHKKTIHRVDTDGRHSCKTYQEYLDDILTAETDLLYSDSSCGNERRKKKKRCTSQRSETSFKSGTTEGNSGFCGKGDFVLPRPVKVESFDELAITRKGPKLKDCDEVNSDRNHLSQLNISDSASITDNDGKPTKKCRRKKMGGSETNFKSSTPEKSDGDSFVMPAPVKVESFDELFNALKTSEQIVSDEVNSDGSSPLRLNVSDSVEISNGDGELTSFVMPKKIKSENEDDIETDANLLDSYLLFSSQESLKKRRKKKQKPPMPIIIKVEAVEDEVSTREFSNVKSPRVEEEVASVMNSSPQSKSANIANDEPVEGIYSVGGIVWNKLKSNQSPDNCLIRKPPENLTATPAEKGKCEALQARAGQDGAVKQIGNNFLSESLFSTDDEFPIDWDDIMKVTLSTKGLERKTELEVECLSREERSEPKRTPKVKPSKVGRNSTVKSHGDERTEINETARAESEDQGNVRCELKSDRKSKRTSPVIEDERHSEEEEINAAGARKKRRRGRNTKGVSTEEEETMQESTLDIVEETTALNESDELEAEQPELARRVRRNNRNEREPLIGNNSNSVEDKLEATTNQSATCRNADAAAIHGQETQDLSAKHKRKQKRMLNRTTDRTASSSDNTEAGVDNLVPVGQEEGAIEATPDMHKNACVLTSFVVENTDVLNEGAMALKKHKRKRGLTEREDFSNEKEPKAESAPNKPCTTSEGMNGDEGARKEHKKKLKLTDEELSDSECTSNGTRTKSAVGKVMKRSDEGKSKRKLLPAEGERSLPGDQRVTSANESEEATYDERLRRKLKALIDARNPKKTFPDFGKSNRGGESSPRKIKLPAEAESQLIEKQEVTNANDKDETMYDVRLHEELKNLINGNNPTRKFPALSTFNTNFESNDKRLRKKDKRKVLLEDVENLANENQNVTHTRDKYLSDGDKPERKHKQRQKMIVMVNENSPSEDFPESGSTLSKHRQKLDENKEDHKPDRHSHKKEKRKALLVATGSKRSADWLSEENSSFRLNVEQKRNDKGESHRNPDPNENRDASPHKETNRKRKSKHSVSIDMPSFHSGVVVQYARNEHGCESPPIEVEQKRYENLMNFLKGEVINIVAEGTEHMKKSGTKLPGARDFGLKTERNDEDGSQPGDKSNSKTPKKTSGVQLQINLLHDDSSGTVSSDRDRPEEFLRKKKKKSKPECKVDKKTGTDVVFGDTLGNRTAEPIGKKKKKKRKTKCVVTEELPSNCEMVGKLEETDAIIREDAPLVVSRTIVENNQFLSEIKKKKKQKTKHVITGELPSTYDAEILKEHRKLEKTDRHERNAVIGADAPTAVNRTDVGDNQFSNEIKKERKHKTKYLITEEPSTYEEEIVKLERMDCKENVASTSAMTVEKKKKKRKTKHVTSEELPCNYEEEEEENKKHRKRDGLNTKENEEKSKDERNTVGEAIQTAKTKKKKRSQTNKGHRNNESIEVAELLPPRNITRDLSSVSGVEDRSTRTELRVSSPKNLSKDLSGDCNLEECSALTESQRSVTESVNASNENREVDVCSRQEIVKAVKRKERKRRQFVTDDRIMKPHAQSDSQSNSAHRKLNKSFSKQSLTRSAPSDECLISNRSETVPELFKTKANKAEAGSNKAVEVFRSKELSPTESGSDDSEVEGKGSPTKSSDKSADDSKVKKSHTGSESRPGIARGKLKESLTKDKSAPSYKSLISNKPKTESGKVPQVLGSKSKKTEANSNEVVEAFKSEEFLPTDSDSDDSDVEGENPPSKSASTDDKSISDGEMLEPGTKKYDIFVQLEYKEKEEDFIDKTLEEVEENTKLIAEEYTALRDLNIMVPWDIPLAHSIETRMSSMPTQQQKDRFKELKVPLKSGPYTKKEDETIRENFEEFCKVHDLPHDPKPFLRFALGNKILLNPQQRIRFVQYLGKHLDCRMLCSVYRRFVTLYTARKKGRFTPEEDAIILKYMDAKKNEQNKFSNLAKILNRERLAVEKRYKCVLARASPKGNKTLCSRKRIPKFIVTLLEVLELEDLNDLKEKEISEEEWSKFSDKMGEPVNTLKRAWKVMISPRVFSAGPLNVDDIMKEVVHKLISLGKADYRDVNWSEIAEGFDNISPSTLYYWFKSLVKAKVPTNRRGDLKRSLRILEELYVQCNTLQRTRSKIVCENGNVSFVNDPDDASFYVKTEMSAL